MIQERTLQTKNNKKGPVIIFSTKGMAFSFIFLQFFFSKLSKPPTTLTGTHLVEVRVTANAKDGMIPYL